MNRYLLLITLTLCVMCIEEVNFKNYLIEMYYKHNTYRALHGSPNIELDEELNKIAQKNVDAMGERADIFYSKNTYKNRTLGENLFLCYTYDGTSCLAVNDVTGLWYREYYDYCFSSKNFNSASNFITLTWKETTLFGCGFHYGRYFDMVDAYFVSCVYYPGPNTFALPTAEEMDANLIDRTDGNRKSDPC